MFQAGSVMGVRHTPHSVGGGSHLGRPRSPSQAGVTVPGAPRGPPGWLSLPHLVRSEHLPSCRAPGGLPRGTRGSGASVHTPGTTVLAQCPRALYRVPLLCCSSPCQHGGSCVDDEGRASHASCLCPPGFSGNFCEIDPGAGLGLPWGMGALDAKRKKAPLPRHTHVHGELVKILLLCQSVGDSHAHPFGDSQETLVFVDDSSDQDIHCPCVI